MRQKTATPTLGTTMVTLQNAYTDHTTQRGVLSAASGLGSDPRAQGVVHTFEDRCWGLRFKGML